MLNDRNRLCETKGIQSKFRSHSVCTVILNFRRSPCRPRRADDNYIAIRSFCNITWLHSYFFTVALSIYLMSLVNNGFCRCFKLPLPVFSSCCFHNILQGTVAIWPSFPIVIFSLLLRISSFAPSSSSNTPETSVRRKENLCSLKEKAFLSCVFNV